VRQIGELRPCSNRSRSDSALTDDLRRSQRRERPYVLLAKCWRQQSRNSVIDTFERVQGPYEGNEFARLQEDQTPIAVMVGQRSKGLVTKRDLVAEAPRDSRVKRSDRRERHDLVDPAKSVYRYLFDKQFLDIADFKVRFLNLKCFARHVFSLVGTKSNASRPPGGTHAKLRG